jgi:hypothetical protein
MVDEVQLRFPAGTLFHLRVSDVDFYGPAVAHVDSGGARGGAHVAQAFFNVGWFCHLFSLFYLLYQSRRHY